MIQVVLKLAAQTPITAEMLHTLRSLMLPLPAEPGFVSCGLYQEDDNPNTILYVEEWDTENELNRQIRSSHYSRLLNLMEAASSVPELRLNWITDVKGLEHLEKIRLGEQ